MSTPPTSLAISLPSTQRVWRAVRKGTPRDGLQLDSAASISTELQPGEILVRVAAAALNPVGYKLLAFLPNWIAARPHVAESDLAGTVVRSDCPSHPVGERVFGYIPVSLHIGRKTKEGALAEYTRLPGDHVARIPDKVSMVDAAGITMAAETALQCLTTYAGIEAGQTIFINGGSSSVGIFAIQIAKILGCTVWAAASGRNKDFVMSYGADVFIDYTKAPLHEQLSSSPPQPKFHAILDAAGLVDQSLYTYSEAYLQPSGSFVTITSGPQSLGGLAGFLWALRPVALGGVPRRWVYVLLKHVEQELLQLAQWMEEGKLRPVTDSIFEFEDALLAYDRIMTTRARGKVVIRVAA